MSEIRVWGDAGVGGGAAGGSHGRRAGPTATMLAIEEHPVPRGTATTPPLRTASPGGAHSSAVRGHAVTRPPDLGRYVRPPKPFSLWHPPPELPRRQRRPHPGPVSDLTLPNHALLASVLLGLKNL